MGPDVEGFERLERIASGGSATVYRAFQPGFDRWVALKVVDGGGAPADDVRRALDEECRLVGRLTGHPNVVTVFGSGESSDGAPFVSMAWFSGGSLADRIDRSRLLGPREVASTGIRLAGALESAHRHGLLHLDVKPANVVLDANGEPALTDFGAGALLAGETGTVRGFTPAFAPPEVAEGRIGTAASDVYGLGCTLRAVLDPDAGPVPALDALLDAMADPSPRERPTLHEVIAVLGRIEAEAGWPATVPVLASPSEPPRSGTTDAGGDPPTLLPPTPRRPSGPPGRGRGRVRAAVLVGVVALVVAAIVVVVGRDDGGDRRPDPDRAASTTTQPADKAADTVVHPPGVADRSAELRAGLGDVGVAAGVLTGEQPLVTDVPVGTYFSTSASFPALDPLPSSARWYFTRTGPKTPPCDPFRSDPVTMDGFAAEVAVASSTIVTVATYSFVDAPSAEVVFGGRSLSLRPADDECTGRRLGPKTVVHHAFEPDLAVPVDQVNTWDWEQPGPLGEVRAYGIVARRGVQLWELRVGVRDDRTFEPAQLLALADAVIGPP